MRNFIISFVLLILLASCSTSIVSTSTPKPTIPATTLTPTPMATQVPTPTATLAPTPDLRIIDPNTDLQNFSLTSEDFTNAGFTDIFPDPAFTPGPLTNDDAISSKLLSTDDINRTGRLIGFLSDYVYSPNNNPKINSSDFANFTITLYKTASGASLAVKYNNLAETNSAIWSYMNSSIDLGDTGVLITSWTTNVYDIEFSFRNVGVEMMVYTTDVDKVEKLAQIILKRLQGAPLVDAIYPSSNVLPTASTNSSQIINSDTMQDKTAGEWLVGTEVAVGKWRAVGGDCYEVSYDSNNNQVDMQSGKGSIININSSDYAVKFVSNPDSCTWTYIGK